MFGRARFESVEVNLPGVKGRWVADSAQQRAAWEMYVELVTRIAVVPLAPDAGLLREALSSLHAIFPETRKILRTHGATVATTRKDGTLSFAAIALDVLNRELRPLLARWHPELASHEASRPPGLSQGEHERSWEYHDALRHDIERVRGTLATYADLLAQVAFVPAVHRPANRDIG